MTEVAKETPYQRWYRKNREQFNAARRARYQKDKDYRKQQRASTQRRRAEERAKRAQQTKPGAPIGDAANLLDRDPQTIRAWEKKGWIPKAETFNSSRYYKPHQIELMRELVKFLEAPGPKASMDAKLDELVTYIKDNWGD